MSEINETMQIVELTGRGALKLGEISIRALQFLFRLAESNAQKALRLEYGEMPLDKLLEKQAMMGDESAVFQVHTQDKKELSAIKKELTERGISFCQLPDFDQEDGFTQFYSIGSDSPKLNAFFKVHESLEAGNISLEDYYNTVPEEKRDEIRKEFQDAPGLESLKGELEKDLSEKPLILNAGAKVIRTEEPIQDELAKALNEKPLILNAESKVIRKEEPIQGELERALNDKPLIFSAEAKVTREELPISENRTVPNMALEKEDISGALSEQHRQLSSSILQQSFKWPPLYGNALEQSGSRQIKVHESLIKDVTNRFVMVQVPGAQDHLQMRIPKKSFFLTEKAEDGTSYAAVLDSKAKYQVVKQGEVKRLRKNVTGKEAQELFGPLVSKSAREYEKSPAPVSRTDEQQNPAEAKQEQIEPEAEVVRKSASEKKENEHKKDVTQSEFKLTKERNVLIPGAEIEVLSEPEGAYGFRPDLTKEYTLVDAKGEPQRTITGEQLFQQLDPIRYEEVLKRVQDKQQHTEEKIEKGGLSTNRTESEEVSKKEKPGMEKTVSRQSSVYQNNAERLNNDAAYKELLRQPDSREITLNENLIKARTDATILFRVPGTNGTLALEIPREHMRLIDNGKTFTAVLDQKKNYRVLDRNKLTEVSGKMIQTYFDEARENLPQAKVIKNMKKDAALRR